MGSNDIVLGFSMSGSPDISFVETIIKFSVVRWHVFCSARILHSILGIFNWEAPRGRGDTAFIEHRIFGDYGS